MQATLSAIGIAIGYILIFLVHITTGRIIIAHIGKRDDTETHAHMTQQAESTYHILKIRVIGILLHTILVEVGNLTRNASIQDERHGVDGRVGSRVEVVHLVVLMKTKTHTIHTTIEARSLVRQYA